MTATTELLRALVAIDSVNPSLVPGARGEAEAARFLQGWLRERGIAAELQEASNDPAISRPNVVAIIGHTVTGKNQEKRRGAEDTKTRREDNKRAGLMIVAHIDTVGAGDMPQPFTPRVEGNRMYGRGALDIKSGVAAMCAAAARIVSEKLTLRKPLVIAAVVDEECNSLGTQKLLTQYSAEAAVVMEPTDLKLCIAHKGYAWFEITTHGRAAHGSLPDVGRDAITMMGRVLNLIDALDKKFTHAPAHGLLGRASLHASLIEGGQELSSYPAECKLQIERRTLPGESDAQVESELRAVLEALRTRDAEFNATLRTISTRAPYEISPQAPIAAAAAQAIARVMGAAPELVGMPFWTDTALLAAAGVPGVVFGPRGRGLHGADEYVELDSVQRCSEVLGELIRITCA